ncbi:efflux transporter outer membrane subunit [Cupriavidus sp. 2TAF22]|uniref:efflux transporter outer membrane subunit n=1 Tax=unclassified Cupriavidus TaxID=2640874 RepID=UPI003F914740
MITARPLPTRVLGIAMACAWLAGCAVGPDYQRPPPDTPAAFREATPPDHQWKIAEPRPVDLSQDWWSGFDDARLNELVVQANAANQSLRQAEAQYRQARALAQGARAGLFPTLGAAVSAGRARTNTLGIQTVSNTHSASLDASWEVDLWGQVRRTIEAARDNAQASAADLAAARLTIQGELVQDYIQLRVTDVLEALYARTLAAYEASLKLTQSQFRAGVATSGDVALAQVTLESARAQAIDLEVQRNQLEHAIAVLLGLAPAQFALPPAAFAMRPLVVPPGLPSALLERRPDIAAAERRMAAANANIGVARAAYFPSLVLSAVGGASSGSLANWFGPPGRVWSLGAALAGTIFDGGLRNAQNDQAVAAYDGAAAAYRQTVLNGLQEVEDNLSALRVLDQEVVVQDRAVDAARVAERVSLAQYRAGTASYLAVVTAQALSLSNERTAIQLRGREFAASVGLIKAIGGGWSSAALAMADPSAMPPATPSGPASPGAAGNAPATLAPAGSAGAPAQP